MSSASDDRFHVEALSSTHDRSAFCCGNDSIDRYFRQTATQDIKRRLAHCFVVVETATGKLAGFYTLTSSSIPLDEIPDVLRNKLPRSLPVGVALIGWLGRDIAFKGQKIGEKLLMDAIRTIASSPIAAHAIIVDAIDDEAAKFYRRFGFVNLVAGRENRMYIPVATALKAIESAA